MPQLGLEGRQLGSDLLLTLSGNSFVLKDQGC